MRVRVSEADVKELPNEVLRIEQMRQVRYNVVAEAASIRAYLLDPSPRRLNDFNRYAENNRKLIAELINTAKEDKNKQVYVQVNLKDRYVGGHSRAVAGYVLAIARGLSLGRTEQELIVLGGLLHDLGKIGVSEAVLLKPGPLAPEEWLEIKKHPIQGYSIVMKATGCEELAKAVLYHHERYDGKGYPAGLRGDDIPLYARILCVADSYEAMTAGRSYRPALSREDAVAELRRCSGSQFDPRVVEVFCRFLNKVSAG